MRSIRQVGVFDPREHSRKSGISFEDDPGVTQQQFAHETDVNVIMARFGGDFRLVPQPNVDGLYGDFTGISDFESAAARVQAARDAFLTLDPSVREQYGNDPSRFLKAAEGLSGEALQALARPRVAAAGGAEGGNPSVSPSGGDSGGSAAGLGAAAGGSPTG